MDNGGEPAIAERLAAVESRLQDACRRAGRRRDEVTLCAVSKRQPDAKVEALAALGIRCFGENLVQAWMGRRATLSGLGVDWHLIGPLQTNKAREVAKHRPALLHTVDRAPLVEALEARLEGPPLPVLIQVNIDREPKKAGSDPDQVDALADRVAASPVLELRGLMCIPRPAREAPPRAAFRRTAEIARQCADRVRGPLVLSMGMSDDFEEAVLEGATLVRIGTLLFVGPRG
jgi:pyridoxal phosphate enzyme (YggS family)